MSQRINRLEEEVRKMRQSVVGLRGVVDRSITEQTRVSTWLLSCMTQLMDASGRTYQAFDSTLIGSSRLSYKRRVKPKTGDAMSHPAKAEARGETSWISLQHNGVYYRDTKRKENNHRGHYVS
ncbi:hypothetical protein Tco_0864725 [Tanacetum coccineum]